MSEKISILAFRQITTGSIGYDDITLSLTMGTRQTKDLDIMLAVSSSLDIASTMESEAELDNRKFSANKTSLIPLHLSKAATNARDIRQN